MMGKRLCEIVLRTVVATTGFMNIVAAETLIMYPPTQHIPELTAREYSHQFKTQPGIAFAYLIYPGVKFGRYVHNKNAEELRSRLSKDK